MSWFDIAITASSKRENVIQVPSKLSPVELAEKRTALCLQLQLQRQSNKAQIAISADAPNDFPRSKTMRLLLNLGAIAPGMLGFTATRLLGGRSASLAKWMTKIGRVNFPRRNGPNSD